MDLIEPSQVTYHTMCCLPIQIWSLRSLRCDYVGYTSPHLFQRNDERKRSVIGKHLRVVHRSTRSTILKKCFGNLGRIHEIQAKTCLKIQLKRNITSFLKDVLSAIHECLMPIKLLPTKSESILILSCKPYIAGCPKNKIVGPCKLNFAQEQFVRNVCFPRFFLINSTS